jgi:hypothetical protein
MMNKPQCSRLGAPHATLLGENWRARLRGRACLALGLGASGQRRY